MTVLIVFIIIGVVAFLGFCAFAVLAGGAATMSAIDQAIDDLEQEKAIREYLEERERKKEEKKTSRCILHKS